MLSLEACLVIISLYLICAENKKANHQNKDDCKKRSCQSFLKSTLILDHKDFFMSLQILLTARDSTLTSHFV